MFLLVPSSIIHGFTFLTEGVCQHHHSAGRVSVRSSPKTRAAYNTAPVQCEGPGGLGPVRRDRKVSFYTVHHKLTLVDGPGGRVPLKGHGLRPPRVSGPSGGEDPQPQGWVAALPAAEAGTGLRTLHPLPAPSFSATSLLAVLLFPPTHPPPPPPPPPLLPST